MDYDLSRVEYTICGVTFPDTLKLLPAAGPKLQQKFAIGDKTGVLQYLSIKDEEPIVHFKTLPGKPITSVQVPYGTPADKIFAASGNEVKGYTRKGKVFLAIETSLSETITSMFILGDDLILCAGRTVTHYRDLREYHSYLCEDRVLDVAAFAIPNSKRVRLLVLIANKGAILLENGSVVTRLTITSCPSRLILPPNINSAVLCSFYGAADGSIGIITYEETMLQSKCLIEGRGLGSVVCMGWYFKDGVHLAVGRHDGSIQLYFIDPENLGEKPRLKYTYFSGEPVTSVCGGCVGTEESEVLAATFSGRVFALRGRKFVSGAGSLVGVPSNALTSRRTKLETEVARLEKQAAVEREKYQRNTRSDHARISAPPLLDIQYESSGATREGWQEIRIASAVPLDMLFVYCNRKLDLQTDSAAVLSVCPSQGPLDDLLATVRCQAGTRRLWVRMRYSNVVTTVQKAESTRVLIYALPAGAPRVARLMTLRLPVLPYYSQHEDPETNFEDRILCQLLVSGSFSVAEMTSWLAEAFPDEMPRPASNVEFMRRHTLLGTLLICQYQRGSASFKSDNVSSIATIKDVILNCTMKKGIRVEISCDIPNGCCAISFKNIQPLFEKEYKKNQNIKLKQALSALDLNTNMSIDDQVVLCNDYQQVWESSDETISDSNFSELVETIQMWYIDWHALTIHGCENNNERRRLLEALNNNQIDEILNIFSKESLHN